MQTVILFNYSLMMTKFALWKDIPRGLIICCQALHARENECIMWFEFSTEDKHKLTLSQTPQRGQI